VDSSIARVGESVIDFLPRFNDRILSLFPSAREAELSLTKSQVRALMLIRKASGQTATELGESLCMTKANMTGILDELESRSLAERAADPGDRRKLRIRLTSAGRKAADSIARELDRRLEERFAPLPRKDRLAFADHLASLSELLDKL